MKKRGVGVLQKLVRNPKRRRRIEVYLQGSDRLWVRKLREVVRATKEKTWHVITPTSFPSIVQVENTSVCNADCIMCPQPEMKRPKKIMQMTLYRKIVDECAQYPVGEFYLHLQGEPLLDPYLGERIRYAKQKGLRNVGFFTNGSLLDRRRSEIILDAGLDYMEVSMDGVTKETYEKIRLKLNFDQVMNNVEGFLRLRKERGLRKPKVVLQCLLMSDTEAEVKAFEKKWKSLADEVLFPVVTNFGGSIEEDYAPSEFMSHRKKRPCMRPWEHFVILQDGKVGLCCLDVEGEIILGDVNTSSIKEIWNTEKWKRLRETLLVNDYSIGTLCEKCTYPETNPWWR